MTTDLRDNTVEELLEMGHDEERAPGGGLYVAAGREIARRLAEAEQQIAEQDAMLAVFHNKLKTTADYLTRYHRQRNMSGRDIWDTDAAHSAYESCMECMAYLPASAEANAEILRQADQLLAWDKKYPKGTLYNVGAHKQCEDELSEIIEAVRAAKGIK